MENTRKRLKRLARAKPRSAKEQAFAAKLLFQFRQVSKGRSNRIRRCERRIVVRFAPDAAAALRMFEKCGKESEFDRELGRRTKEFFEFVGVLDLMRIGIECGEGEVWWERGRMLNPMERRGRLLPSRQRLVRDAD